MVKYKKAQAAMEFLMTYGWAILVVLIAIGALAYFGVLNPGRFLPESCTITPGVSCEEFRVTSDGQIDLVILNGMGEVINDVKIYIYEVDTEILLCEPEPDGDDTMNDGEILAFNASDCGINNEGRFKADILFVYAAGESGLIHTKTGNLLVQVE